jgi:peptidoglycan/xylan/chitin deacetylase (PgdA/CDA1 family)
MNIISPVRFYGSVVASKLGLLKLYADLVKNQWLIITYHRVVQNYDDDLSLNLRNKLIISEANFEKQLSYLSKHANVKSLRDVILSLKSNKRIDPKTVVITFDDGYKDNYEVAYPLLVKYNLPATIFITTGPIDTREVFWWDKVNSVLYFLWNIENSIDVFYESPISMFVKNMRDVTLEVFSNSVVDSIKGMERHQRKNILDRLFEWSDSFDVPFLESPMLTWKMVTEMAKNNISFENHTVNHKYLTELSLEEILQETVPATNRIQEITGQPGNILACPNGNIPLDKIEALKKEFLAICTTSNGLNAYDQDLYNLKRKDSNFFLLNQKFSKYNFFSEMIGLPDNPRLLKLKINNFLKGHFL